MYCKKTKGDVFAYDVIPAILNNLHILKYTQGFTSGTRRIGISTSILTKSHQINLFMSKNKGDVFVYDVLAAILNNLHILRNTQGFTSGTRRIWIQHLDIDKSHQINLFMSKNKGDVFVYDVMAAILNNLHILRNTVKVSRLGPGGFGFSTSILTKSIK